MAKTYACVAVCWNAAVWLAVILPTLLFATDAVCWCLADNSDVKTLLKPLIVMYAFTGVFDQCANTLGASLKAMGIVIPTAYAYTATNYFIVLPCVATLVLYFQQGVFEVWILTNIGTVAVFSICWWLMSRVSFEKMVSDAIERCTS